MMTRNGGYGPSIGTGYIRRKLGSKKCVKTLGKLRFLLESGREKSPGAGNQHFAIPGGNLHENVV